MKVNKLQVQKNRSSRRVGRGISAGQGKTAGRGTKGQKSRAGSGRKPGFEGGQNPLYKRIPKLRGFKPVQRAEKVTITTEQLNAFKGSVDNFTIYEARITSSPSAIVRVVEKGEVTAKLTVSLQGATPKAIKAIEKAGGTFKKTDRVKQTSTKSDDK